MTGYEKAVELGLSGTDAEIVAVLHTLTVADIPVDRVRTWLRENLLWYAGADGAMKGVIAQAYTGASSQHQAGLDYFHATVFGSSADYLRTTSAVWAPQVHAIVILVEALAPSVASLVDSFYGLDGGRPYKEYTVEQYAADAATASAGQARQAIVDACLAPIRTAQAAAGTRLNNAIASLGAEHIDGLTLEQLQARCDAVAASADGLVGE